MSMTIFGQNEFQECFHSNSPDISYIKLSLNFLEYYDVRSIEGYPTESFSQVEIPETQWRFEFSKKAKRLHICHGNVHEG